MNGVSCDVCGGWFDIQISWSHLLVQQVLRALPAETKVDGLPRDSSDFEENASQPKDELF